MVFRILMYNTTMSHTILLGDVREQLKTLPDNSVQCCVTSPPYFGLRDYGMSEQIGLEPTPDAFVDALVSVFREVRRVLREDGTLWVNIGDSYAGAGYSNHDLNGSEWKSDVNGDKRKTRQQDQRKALTPLGIKSKDLIGIPWMLAFALRKDGWYLRQDIIWSKTSCMPESVKDRCTKSHEYLFLLTKSPRYYFDAEAIKTPAKQDWGTRDRQHGKYHNEGSGLQPHSGLTKSYAMANKRSVWTITPSNFKGAHFATFPEALVEPCILAGSKPNDTVLDPFLGSGTTLAVAKRLGRNGIGVELNPEYAQIAETRIAAVPTPLV